jgi:hypothetical protein
LLPSAYATFFSGLLDRDLDVQTVAAGMLYQDGSRLRVVLVDGFHVLCGLDVCRQAFKVGGHLIHFGQRLLQCQARRRQAGSAAAMATAATNNWVHDFMQVMAG